jgi:hypothetical protein
MCGLEGDTRVGGELKAASGWHLTVFSLQPKRPNKGSRVQGGYKGSRGAESCQQMAPNSLQSSVFSLNGLTRVQGSKGDTRGRGGLKAMSG